MATTSWVGQQLSRAQVVTLQVTSVAAAGTLTATINGKQVTYTCTGADNTSTAAAAWQSLLAVQAAGEFREIAWSVSSSTVTATAASPGTPFYNASWGLSASAGGGAGVTLTETVTNLSPSDVNDAQNWLRSGSASIPQNGDDVVVANSTVPLLWNLDKLAAVTFASYTRWQTFAATVGLPDQNPAGYKEYRPTYFQFDGNASPIQVILGQGVLGSGPSRERYNVGARQVVLNVLASGSAADSYSVTFLGTSASNVVNVQNASVGIATGATETSAVASATVDGGGRLDLGAGVTFSGTLTYTNSSGVIACAPATLNAYNGSQVTVTSSGLTYAAVTAINGSLLSWRSNSTITTLTLATGAALDKSQDIRAMTVTNATIDMDTSVVSDPNSSMTWTNAVAGKNQVSSGWYQTGPNRTWKVT